MKHFRSKIFLAFLFIFGLLPIAFSDWVVTDKDNRVSVNASSNVPVCYINKDEASNRYYAIEKALQKAQSGDVVYVIPKTNPVINHDCEIKAGVTLTIGGLTKGGSFIKDSNGNYTYADHGVTNEKDASTLENSPDNRGPHFTTETFADSYTTEKGIHGEDIIKEYSDTYRQNQVLLNACLKISSSAQLNIGGRLGRELAGLSGGTTGDYCEIVMTGKGSIENYGIIDCLGYIKQQDASANKAIVNCYSGSTMKMPFIIQDFNGGVYTVSCNPQKGQKVMPFNEWICCNVQVKQTYYYNSSLKGYYDVYNQTHMDYKIIVVQKGHKWGEVDLIGLSNSVITFDNNKKNGKVVVDVITDDYKHTTVALNRIINKKNKLSFYGNCGINQMVIPNPMPGLSLPSTMTNVEIGDVYTSKFFFSINHYYDADIYGTLNVGTDQKVLPGCNVTVKKGGTLKISSKVIFVENLDEVASGATKMCKYPTIYNQTKNNSSVLNALKVEGSLIVEGANSAIGGKIYSSTIDASVDLLGANAVNVTYKEGADGVMKIDKFLNIPTKANFNITYQDPAQSENARGPVLSTSSVAVSDFSKSMYVYTQEGGNIGWKAATDLDSFSVTFHINGGTASYADGYKKNFYLKKDQVKTITSISIDEPSKSHYVFEGWYLDGSFSKSLSSGVEVKNGTVLDLYAKFGIEKYKVSYNILNASDIETEFTNPNTLTEFTYNDFVNNGNSYHIVDATSNIPDQIMFDGWYTDSSYSIESKLSNNNITECKNYDLFGRFVKVRPKVTIEGVYINGNNTFIVDENGKLPSDVINAINQTVSESKKDINDPKYITGLSLTQNGDSISVSSYVFTENQNLYLIKDDKNVVNYVLDSNTTLKKYFVRDEYGKIFAGVKPVFNLDADLNSNASYTKNQERHVYKWKVGNTDLANNSSTETETDIAGYINNSPTESSYSFVAWWAYRLIIDAKSSGSKKARITCNCIGENNSLNDYELKDGDSLTRYIVSGQDIRIVIPNYYGIGTKTSVSSVPNIISGSNSSSLNPVNQGKWSKSVTMPEYAVTITIT